MGLYAHWNRHIPQGRASLAHVLSKISAPPRIEVRVLREHLTPGSGFLTLRRYDVVTEHVGKDSSTVSGRSITYDLVERKYPDAVVVVPHYVRNGRTHVLLRSCVRPPVALRGSPQGSSKGPKILGKPAPGSFWRRSGQR